MTAKGFVELIDKEGNTVSVPEGKARILINGGWRRVGDPPKKPKAKSSNPAPATEPVF